MKDMVLVQVGEGGQNLDEKVADRLLVEVALHLRLPLDEVLRRDKII